MKALHRSLRIFLASVAISALTLLYSCGGSEPEPEPTAAEAAVINLTNSAWKVNSVTIDGVDKTSMFTNLSITFTPTSTTNGKPSSLNGSFTAVNGGLVWPASGTWSFPNTADGNNVLRGDGVSLQLTELTATTLKISLAWSKTTFGTGRSAGLKGQHVFTMGK
jgi:hypothetical protein